MSLEYVDPATAAVSSTSFSSQDSTVVVTAEWRTSRFAAARPENGQVTANNGDNVGAAGVHATEIVILAADTGLVLDRDTVTGQVTIQACRYSNSAMPAEAHKLSTPCRLKDQQLIHHLQETIRITS